MLTGHFFGEEVCVRILKVKDANLVRIKSSYGVCYIHLHIKNTLKLTKVLNVKHPEYHLAFLHPQHRA